MPDQPPTVLAIGSCRVFRPLRRLHDAGEIRLANYGADQWFTHTAAAAKQYIDVLDGKVRIPRELRPAALESDFVFPADMSDPDKLRGDVVIVEVSSLKQHRVDGFQLNAHRVYGVASVSGQSATAVTQGDTSTLPDDHVLKGMEVNYAKQEDLALDLLAIQDRIGAPVVTVNHLYSERLDGTLAPERAKLTEALRLVESLHGIPLYDTQKAILERGVERALLDQNHYRPEFELDVGKQLLVLAQRAINRRVRHTSPS